jgi:hypothetical protein
MTTTEPIEFIAFVGQRLIAAGGRREVARAAWTAHQAGETRLIVLDAAESRPVELDLRGDLETALARLPAEPEPERRGPGRPKLGVVAREVTLLPRHWERLATQPGGASVALRKLVEDARRSKSGEDRKRHAQGVALRFMTTMAGNLAGYEDATRALFAGDQPRFNALTEPWPADIRDHARRLAAGAFEAA